NKVKDEIDAAQTKSRELLTSAEKILATAEESTQKTASEIEKYLAKSRADSQEITAMSDQARNALVSDQARNALARTAIENTDAPQSATSFSVVQLKRLYNVPEELKGAGQCIGLIELGGGFRDSDLDKYFQRLKIPR